MIGNRHQLDRVREVSRVRRGPWVRDPGVDRGDQREQGPAIRPLRCRSKRARCALPAASRPGRFRGLHDV